MSAARLDDVTTDQFSRPGPRPRLSRSADRLIEHAGALVVLWTVGYGALRAYWALGNAPYFAPIGEDLVIWPGWGSVGLCAVAAVVAIVQARGPYRRVVAVAGWLVTGALLASGALLLLDIVGGVLVGLGIPFDPAAAASRATCVAGAGLLAVSTRTYQRRSKGVCLRCGRGEGYVGLRHTPRWAFVGAYAAVLGCLARILVQYGLDFGVEMPYNANLAAVIFEVGFVLAGTLLPLALAHRFGRIWPFWVPWLAGRRVPRWLVLGPGLLFSVGLVAYFGIGLGQLLADTVTGTEIEDAAFLWSAVTAYWVWGLGMGAAAVSYLRLTRPPCPLCLRG